MKTSPNSEMPWTGERFTPDVGGDTGLEHLHRYAMAQVLCAGKRVLDIACGEGYGSHLLAGSASSVVGIDIDATAIAHAQDKYQLPNLEFRQGSSTNLLLPNSCIDLAISFETLEHLDEHEAMLRELRRVLTPDGILFISTPDRLHYSDERNYINPFHVRELYADEFRMLIGDHFSYATFYGQRVVYASLTTHLGSGENFVSYSVNGSTVQQSEGLQAPLYLLAIASTSPLPALPHSMFDGTDALQRETQATLKALWEAKSSLASANLHLKAVYDSVYWQLTKPLRWTYQTLKRALGRSR